VREQAAAEQKCWTRRGASRRCAICWRARQVDARQGLAAWQDKIRAKSAATSSCAGHRGNPEAIYDVTLLPTGEILTVVKRKSSGNAGYDEASARLLKSSPLPKPTEPGLFRRS